MATGKCGGCDDVEAKASRFGSVAADAPATAMEE